MVTRDTRAGAAFGGAGRMSSRCSRLERDSNDRLWVVRCQNRANATVDAPHRCCLLAREDWVATIVVDEPPGRLIAGEKCTLGAGTGTGTEGKAPLLQPEILANGRDHQTMIDQIGGRSGFARVVEPVGPEMLGIRMQHVCRIAGDGA